MLLNYTHILLGCFITTVKTLVKFHNNFIILNTIFTATRFYIDDLVKDCSNSTANALELQQSCTKPSIWSHYKIYYAIQTTALPWEYSKLCLYPIMVQSRQTWLQISQILNRAVFQLTVWYVRHSSQTVCTIYVLYWILLFSALVNLIENNAGDGVANCLFTKERVILVFVSWVVKQHSSNFKQFVMMAHTSFYFLAWSSHIDSVSHPLCEHSADEVKIDYTMKYITDFILGDQRVRKMYPSGLFHCHWAETWLALPVKQPYSLWITYMYMLKW